MAESATHYAVKHFRPEKDYTSASVIRAEYQALCRLAAVNDYYGPVRVRSPLPGQLWDWGYVMSMTNGCPLDHELLSGRITEQFLYPLAEALVGVLNAYHRHGGTAYADFHDGNILIVNGAELVLLDPGAPLQSFYSWPDELAPPMAVDIGYWVFSATTRSLRQAVRHPSGVRKRLRMAVALVRAALGCGMDWDWYLRCTHDFYQRLADRGLRERLTARCAELLSAAAINRRVAAGRTIDPPR
jgi:hypothetical protein